MATDSSALFAENRVGLLTPILPDVPVSAANIKVTPGAAENYFVEKLDPSTIAANAYNAGESLRSMKGALAPQGDASYMGGQAPKLAMEAGGAALKLGGQAISGLLEAVTGKPDEIETHFKPAPVFAQGMPSPGSGSMG